MKAYVNHISTFDCRSNFKKPYGSLSSSLMLFPRKFYEFFIRNGAFWCISREVQMPIAWSDIYKVTKGFIQTYQL